jgi:hypothetical protein
VFGSGALGYGRDGLRDGGAVVRAAQKEIGVQEHLENAGPRVDQYNAYVGLHKVAWCASFVSWVHGQAGYKEPRTAWSPALFPAERQIKMPVQGAVLGIYYPHLKRIGHCGIVERIRNDLVYVIEGNTNVNGGREGIGVYRKIRHKRAIAAYSDWLQSK